MKAVRNCKKSVLWIGLAAALVCALAAFLLTGARHREALDWARNLRAEDVTRVELVVMPQSPDRQYKVLSGEESAGVVSLLRQSRGRYVAKPEEYDGGSIFFYIETADGVRHAVGNISNVYLYIDGEYYDAGYDWLSEWDRAYGAGNAPLPDGFFDNRLTMNDVRRLARKGNALSWRDFDGYAYTETGSGLYIRIYRIDALFSVWIGGSGTEQEPLYVYLCVDSEEARDDERIDVRTGDVDAFAAEHQDDTPKRDFAADGAGEASAAD